MVGEFAFLLFIVMFLISSIIIIAHFVARVINSALDPIDQSVGQSAYAYTSSNGKTYYLHLDKKMTKNGKVNRLHYFRLEQMDNAISVLPDGYTITENANGVPLLKLAV